MTKQNQLEIYKSQMMIAQMNANYWQAKAISIAMKANAWFNTLPKGEHGAVPRCYCGDPFYKVEEALEKMVSFMKQMISEKFKLKLQSIKTVLTKIQCLMVSMLTWNNKENR